ncbi:arrestin domain-containing protein 17-like isoform X2 [Polistes fuscatus]|uniref:arrestin domain-containing protein 17-like isoform X2 n=1 Tax=Polistes fuscatus TaxID=30207 RepID=UPI001CA7C06A|nr:arrestin domain-containing protein 17-like isoform X2 [Polistes fuscatus]
MKDQEESEPTSPISETTCKSIGFQRIDLVLDHPQKVYYSGNEITGKINLYLDEPVDAIGIRLKCKGEAQVYFTDRSAGIRRKFSSGENYLHEEIYIIGDRNAKNTITEGVYPFSLTLPENLPCSFEGRYGRVRYSIRALLDITSVYRFSTNIIPFTVAPTLDLNRDSLAPLPVSEKQSKVYMGQTESLNMSMSLPVRGYVPGQTIPIQILLKNYSNVIMYHATEKSRKHKEIVVEIEQPIDKNCESYDIVFDVPAVPPTGMIHCNIIDVLYTLKAEACVDVSEWYYRMFQKNLKLRTNVIVGTIPLRNYEDPQNTLSMPLNTFSPNVITTSEASYLNENEISTKEIGETNQSEVILPVYEKSQIYRSSKPDRDDPTGDDGDSDGEVKPYSPVYRVYKFKSSTKRKDAN